MSGRFNCSTPPGLESLAGWAGWRVATTSTSPLRNGERLWGITEPKVGRHLTHATKNRKRAQFASAMRRIADAYPKARTIHLILDNLNIHTEKSLTEALGEKAGAQLWGDRFTLHYTPKHASWLNPAEIELSLWSRECLGGRSHPDLP